jgi:hypothetical protein
VERFQAPETESCPEQRLGWLEQATHIDIQYIYWTPWFYIYLEFFH